MLNGTFLTNLKNLSKSPKSQIVGDVWLPHLKTAISTFLQNSIMWSSWPFDYQLSFPTSNSVKNDWKIHWENCLKNIWVQNAGPSLHSSLVGRVCPHYTSAEWRETPKTIIHREKSCLWEDKPLLHYLDLMFVELQIAQGLGTLENLQEKLTWVPRIWRYRWKEWYTLFWGNSEGRMPGWQHLMTKGEVGPSSRQSYALVFMCSKWTDATF